MSDKILSINDIIEQERLAKQYVSIEEGAKLFNVSERTFREIAKNVKDVIEVEANGGSKKKLYNKKEVLNIKSSKDFTLAEKNAENNSIVVNATAFSQSLNKLDLSKPDNMIKLIQARELMNNQIQDLLEKRLKEVEQENKELTKENTELKEKEQERLYIENEKYKSKELRTKISKTIRKYCYNNNVNYSDFMIKLYRIYDNIHCFPFKENYKEYIDIIQERGHLKELYNIVLNNI